MRESINSEEVALLIVNLSKSDNIKKAKEIMSDKGISDLSYYDTEGLLPSQYNIIGIPATFYITPDGIIKNISYGAENASSILKKINE